LAEGKEEESVFREELELFEEHGVTDLKRNSLKNTLIAIGGGNDVLVMNLEKMRRD